MADDFLTETIRERSKRNPDFSLLVDAALARRELLHELANERQAKGLSQTAVAAKMETSQSFVARLERGDVDTKISSVERFAAAVGKRVQWQLVDVDTH
ncbi:MAG: helix-turn-helix transcriptional regulator [Actinomycetota bacterium]|nr:helix-turn-helix transcriptional regulator [Actinomycetota bacterium]